MEEYTEYIVETEERGAPGGYGKDKDYKLYWREEQDLEILDEH